MKKSRLFSLLLTGLLTVSTGVTSVYATEGEIADMQAWKQEAEAGLAEAEAEIYGLESKKQELEYYLADLNAQYEELTNSISELSIEAAQKEVELKKVRKDLKRAKKAADKQYEAMKLRIAYIYENSGATTLELLFSSKSMAEFLNRTENVAQISKYDRNMLAKYEALRAEIKEQEQTVRQESEAIGRLMTERASKKQEVQALAANTNDDIACYIEQISASEAEAAALMSEISSADNSIAALLRQAEEEEAARQEAAEEASDGYDEAYDENYNEDYDDSDEEYGDSSDTPKDNGDDGDGGYDGSDSQESADSAGEGTYLGNFTLTAYCNCAQCCGTAGNLTASGTVPAAGRTVAMAGVPFGTKLLINGNVYTVEDLGTPYGHVDIYFNTHEEALSFGLQSADVYQM